MEFRVLSQREIPAITELMPKPCSSGITAAEVAAAKKKLHELGVEMPASLGSYDNIKAFLERLFFRKFIRYLPEVTTTFTWFECHVPPGGKSILTCEESHEKDSGLEFSLFGSEVGLGRSIQLGREQTSGVVLQCCAHYFKVLLKPHVYHVRGGEDIALDIVKIIDTGTIVNDKCNFCGKAPGTIDPFNFSIGQGIDCRNDKVNARKSLIYEWKRDFKIRNCVKIPGVPFELKLSGGISDSKKCMIDYEWPPGYIYVPYVRTGPQVFQTPMWAIEQ